MGKFALKGTLVLSSFILAAVSTGVWAHDMASMPEKKIPAAFEKLKSLKGTWVGKQKMGAKTEKIVVTYELTAGGSAVVERLFRGTPHEMTSVYYVQGDKVGMTHYCMLGNQPMMTLSKSDDNSMTFEMKGNQGISSSKEPHMHGMTLTWVDAKHIKSQWVEYDNGKQTECVGFTLAKKK
jgi:hypothetical protein